ncbi:MAG: Fe-S cluster assembly protein HesB [Gammaproteobacteria bacterium]|nr:Fe-S cluster assembly protein HesB [Gammaproteobacteria bacterium]MDD9807362.1 Fe-S cluster assembly protein HesB [Gammaproteobacteria bacterium]MDD9868445.1 Fe-S cluster assembly protein HesB [Gammaproteobacteria bacterium]MDD9886817.1 Fe-S cluster assembly protein HesB [Gammaproteobacteria bacterium]
MTPDRDEVIRVTPSAAAQIRKSAEQGNVRDWPLRIAVQRLEDDSFHYMMGFDAAVHEDDLSFTSGDVSLIVSSEMLRLLKDMTLDYVELEEGRFHFIFLNPNDPAWVPPAETQ